MIRYDLKCDQGHVFEAWFASSDAFDDQSARGLVSCSLCGSPKVEKSLMAPRVPKKGNARAEGAPQPQPPSPVAAGDPEIARKLSELRAEIESKSDYVGRKFASEARSMHLGDKEHRSIYGEASPEEAKSLIEDGVPVAPLPFMPKRNS